MTRAVLGVIGLGTMGRNLAMNVESHGFPVAVWNREQDWTTEFIASNAGGAFTGTASTDELLESLERPRRVLIMIPAGKPVDEMIERLAPRLDTGDILIDGGNSWFEDTQRRERDLRPRGIHFVGCGVSGGEQGAREGPSIMPGGSAEAWAQLKDIFEAIAAKTEAGPCVTHVGPDGAGHFVKMVHNGIEYADMQLIAESWDVMRRLLNMSAAQTADVFETWNEGRLGSFLVELTSQVCRVADPADGSGACGCHSRQGGAKGHRPLDGAGGTRSRGAACDDRRGHRGARHVEHEGRARGGKPAAATPRYHRSTEIQDSSEHLGILRDALYASRICAYAQGMALIAAASRAHNWKVNLSEVARIWKGGCIIRARLLDPIRHAFERNPELPNLLLDEELGRVLVGAHWEWQSALRLGSAGQVPMPAHAASVAYFDSYRSARLPQNLTQAQRDAFGAHKYERIDRPGQHHTEW